MLAHYQLADVLQDMHQDNAVLFCTGSRQGGEQGGGRCLRQEAWLPVCGDQRKGQRGSWAGLRGACDEGLGYTKPVERLQ